MTQARCESEWNHTASLMALLANINRDPKKQSSPFKPEDFHPLMPKKPKSAVALTMNDLKAAFGVRKKKRIQK